MPREAAVVESIVKSLQGAPEADLVSPKLRRRIRLFFVLHRLRLIRHKHDLFLRLRERWAVTEEEYFAAFRDETCLQSIGSMGYSGSTFFKTTNGNYLVKSVPRNFEYSFFRDDLLQPYAEHMLSDINSLLIRITDFLAASPPCIGSILGLAPSHHIVMENLTYGQDQAASSAGSDWETWDLKPDDYFFPERDIAGGHLASEATKSKLADRFDHKIVLSSSQAETFMSTLEADTRILRDTNAVDYSLFLVRIPLPPPPNPFDDPPEESSSVADIADVAPVPPDDSPLVPPGPPSWRTGIKSKDGKYVFRAAILDFFWAKHKTQPKLMTFLIKAWNLIDRQGPMSITTTPEEYRNRFLHMCRSFLEVEE